MIFLKITPHFFLLFQAKDIVQCVQNVWSVCRLAQSRPNWKGPKLGNIKKAAPSIKKWADVNTTPQFKSQEEVKALLSETGKFYKKNNRIILI